MKFYTAHTRTPRFLEIKLRFSYYDSFYIIGKKRNKERRRKKKTNTVVRVEDTEPFLGQMQIRAT